MNITPTDNMSLISGFLRKGFVMLVWACLSFGYLAQFISYFDSIEIELTEEKDIEPEEKEIEKETEKDEIMNTLFSFSFINQEILVLRNVIHLNWKHMHGDIPTPPPKSILV